MTRLTCIPLLLLAISLAIPMNTAAQSAQSPELEAQKEAMASVAFLVGEWRGSGWWDVGQGRIQIESSEVVESRLDGLALVIEGHHTSRMDTASEPVVVHHALAMMTYDPDADEYRFNTQVARGGTGMYSGYVEDGAFIWRMTAGGGQIRYTIQIDDEGRWHETGHFSNDGATWEQFFAMTLARVR